MPSILTDALRGRLTDNDRAALDEFARSADPGGRRFGGGFWLPASALVPPSRRSLDATSGSGAVATLRVPPSAFTDVLRSKSILGTMGAEHVSFFGGGVPIGVPRLTAGATPSWVADGDDLPESDLKIGAGGGADAMKTVGALVNVTRKMWRYAGGVEFQEYLANVLTAALASAVDRAALSSAGGTAPLGIVENTDVPVASIAADGGAPTRAHLVGAMKLAALGDADSPATARMGWVTNPAVEAKLRLTDGGMGDGPLWTNGDTIMGRPAIATTSVPDDLTKGAGTGLSALIYGDWNAVLVNHAPNVYVKTDEATGLAKGNVRLAVWMDVTIVLRNPAAFVMFKDVATS